MARIYLQPTLISCLHTRAILCLPQHNTHQYSSPKWSIPSCSQDPDLALANVSLVVETPFSQPNLMGKLSEQEILATNYDFRFQVSQDTREGSSKDSNLQANSVVFLGDELYSFKEEKLLSRICLDAQARAVETSTIERAHA